jgi:hypothetical protein
MRKFMRYATVPMSIAALSACADQSSGPTGPQGNLNLSVAPLTLPGIDNASYGITVKNGTQVVWSEGAITANDYGDGSGSITYIGTCDASAATNSVELVLNSLSDSSGVIAPTEYENPCPSSAPCVQTVSCIENTDTFIEYNLAIMRDANQGFFDIAVNFSDVFCSAKVDCQPALLTDSSGGRVPTVVVGFACTAGAQAGAEADNSTTLYVDWNVVGADGAVLKDLNLKGQGNQENGLWAIYHDKEEFSGFQKGFWNLAYKVGDGVRIAGKMTATGQKGFGSGTGYVSYPVFSFDYNVPSKTCPVNPLVIPTATYTNNPNSANWQSATVADLENDFPPPPTQN